MKNVVIIGGGPGGTKAAMGLGKKKDLNVTLIDRCASLNYYPAAARAMVDAKVRSQVLIERDTKHYTMVVGEATGISDTEVTVNGADGATQVPYDILVIATGAVNRALATIRPLTSAEEMRNQFSSIAEEISKASKITIVGGGPVGCELATEIKGTYADKEVTIVNSGPHLLSASSIPALPEAFGTEVQQNIEAMGITVMNNSRVDGDIPAEGYAVAPGPLQVGSNALETDFAFYAVGTKVETGAFEESLPTEKGFIKVDAFLRVEGKENVFALGDCANVQESKLAYVADTVHAPIIVANVAAVAHGKSPKKKHSPWKKPTMMLPLGPTKAIAFIGFLPFGGGIHRKGMLCNMKNSSNLFLNQAWPNFGGRKCPT